MYIQPFSFCLRVFQRSMLNCAVLFLGGLFRQVLESPALDNEINTMICMFASYLRTRAPDSIEKDDFFQDLLVAVSEGKGKKRETLKEESPIMSTGAQEISERISS